MIQPWAAMGVAQRLVIDDKNISQKINKQIVKKWIKKPFLAF